MNKIGRALEASTVGKGMGKQSPTAAWMETKHVKDAWGKDASIGTAMLTAWVDSIV